jgi:hypothetical protein
VRRSKIATLVAAIFFVASVTVQSADGAPSRQSYPLGHNNSCEAHFVKRKMTVKAKGKIVVTFDCVNVGLGRAAPQYAVSVDANEPTADGYPITKSLSVSALVTDTQVKTIAPTGYVRFALNGVTLTQCSRVILVANEFNGGGSTPYLSTANCVFRIRTTGIVAIDAIVSESDGAFDTDSLKVYVVP